jgi:hypothetical protein
MSDAEPRVSLRKDPPPGYVMQSRDTEYWAEEAQFEHWRNMDEADKGELVVELCRCVFEMHLVGLRELHPHATEDELLLRSPAIRHGRDFVKAWTGFDADVG